MFFSIYQSLFHIVLVCFRIVSIFVGYGNPASLAIFKNTSFFTIFSNLGQEFDILLLLETGTSTLVIVSEPG